MNENEIMTTIEKIQSNTENSTSEQIGELVKALAKVQGSIKPAKKESENPFFKQKYADLTSVWDSCRKELSTNGLAVIQTTKNSNGEVTVVTTLAHESGQWIRGELTMKPIKNDPQGIGSAITYARRYALAAMIGIATEDDDAETATRRDEKKKELKGAKKGQKKGDQQAKQQDDSIVKIHTLKKKLTDVSYFSDDESYREFLYEQTGKRSSKELTRAKRDEVIRKMAHLYNEYSSKERVENG